MENKISKDNLKIVFFGTPEFAVASLDALYQRGYNIEAVVTMPDKIAGRGHKMIQSDVKKYAEEKGLRILQPEKLKSPEFVETLREINADLFIIIAFRMLPEIVWSMPRLGTFNLHGSLLPKYRGAAPINRAIMNGEKETGITTFFLKHEIDTGDMIEQVKTEITEEDNAGSVHDRLMQLGADCVIHTVESLIDGTLTTSPQPDGEFVPAPKIFKEDCEIDWTKSAREIFNHIRGLSPYPAAWSVLQEPSGKRYDVKIIESRVSTDNITGIQPGEVRIQAKRFLVGTGNGILEIKKIQPAGKKSMYAAAFLLGYHPHIFIKKQA